MKALVLTLVAASALIGCGSSSDDSAHGATAGADAGGMAGADAGGAGSLTDVDALCATDCAIGNSSTGTASCQSDDCQARCIAKYNDPGVAAVEGCQAAFLAVLQCGTSAPAIAWSCYNGMPFPLGSSTCLPLGLQVANDAECSMALRNAN